MQLPEWSKNTANACLLTVTHFQELPCPYEPEQSTERPDFCIGTVDGNTTRHLRNMAIRTLQSDGNTVAMNYPYAGSMIPGKYFGDSRVQTIMVEINRSLYQKQGELLSISNYRRIKNKIGILLNNLSAAF